jgi:hypothetical protein
MRGAPRCYMSFPAKPKNPYDYVTFQAGSPADPLPANQVAGDFASHKASIDAVIEFQKLVQRSDGRLNNGSVRPETLSAGTVARIGKWTPRGNWLTATAYAVNDLVTESNNLYVCIVAHTSGTSATDLAAGKWMALDATSATLGANQTFAGVNTFSGVVNFDGAVDFDAAVDMTGGTPTVATKAVGDNTQAPASTAFVQAAVGKVYPPQVFTSPPTTVRPVRTVVSGRSAQNRIVRSNIKKAISRLMRTFRVPGVPPLSSLPTPTETGGRDENGNDDDNDGPSRGRGWLRWFRQWRRHGCGAGALYGRARQCERHL